MQTTEALYNDIWEQLKAKGTCKIAAHPALHARIIHAVINKKYYDAVYKFELAEKNKKSKITYSKSANQIKFSLTVTLNFKSLTTGDI